MPSKPKFRQDFEAQQLNQPKTTAGFQTQGKEAAKKTDIDNKAGQNNQQDAGQWGEDRANAVQNTSDTNNSPVNQSGRGGSERGPEEVPMENDTPQQFPEKGGSEQLS